MGPMEIVIIFTHMQASKLPHNTKVFNLCLIKKIGLESLAKDKAKSVKDVYFTGKRQFINKMSSILSTTTNVMCAAIATQSAQPVQLKSLSKIPQISLSVYVEKSGQMIKPFSSGFKTHL
jgi:hypothetical protein